MQTEVPPSSNGDGKKISVKIFGVGSAGGVMLEQMQSGDFAGASYVAINAEFKQPLAGVEKIHLETKMFRGLGTGGDPDRGRKAAEEHFQKLKDACAGAQVVFILTGLGGGAGTGISPVLARAAKEVGALALAFVTLPFPLDSNHRREIADEGLETLMAVASGVICLPNRKVAKLIDEHMSLLDGYGFSRQLLIEGVRGIWRLLTHKGLIEIHFEELSALLRERQGESSFAAVEAAGTTRSRDALEKLLSHPLLDGGEALKTADAVLVSLMGGPDLSMADVNRVMEAVNQECGRARIIMGAAVDEAFRDRLCVTVVATRHNAEKTERLNLQSLDGKTDEGDFDSELLHKTETKRTASRVVAPAPELTTEQREQIISKHGKGRSRKSGPRMKQTTLQLDVVSKGRFDKTEPTVHKGEDLDLPTYIRRGVALN
jgi:cell division protein FtsZ